MCNQRYTRYQPNVNSIKNTFYICTSKSLLHTFQYIVLNQLNHYQTNHTKIEAERAFLLSSVPLKKVTPWLPCKQNREIFDNSFAYFLKVKISELETDIHYRESHTDIFSNKTNQDNHVETH